MSYKISYGNITERNKKKRRFSWTIPCIAVGIIAICVITKMLFPAEVEQLTDTLLPLFSDASQKALDAFLQHIQEGERFGEAVTAFCLEIINEAGVS